MVELLFLCALGKGMKDVFRHPIGLGLRSAGYETNTFVTFVYLFSIAEGSFFCQPLKMSDYTQVSLLS